MLNCTFWQFATAVGRAVKFTEPLTASAPHAETRVTSYHAPFLSRTASRPPTLSTRTTRLTVRSRLAGSTRIRADCWHSTPSKRTCESARQQQIDAPGGGRTLPRCRWAFLSRRSLKSRSRSSSSRGFDSQLQARHKLFGVYRRLAAACATIRGSTS